MGFCPLWAEVGVCEIKGPRVGPVDGAGAEAEADPHNAVLFPDARRGAAEDLREGCARKLRVKHVPVPAALDGLDEHGHALSAPLYAVFALIFARRGVIGGGVDGLYRAFELRAALPARSGIGGKACRVLSREGEVDVVLKRRGGAHGDGILYKVKYLFKRFVERRRQVGRRADLVQLGGIRMRAQIHQPLPEVVVLHEFVEDRSRDDEGIFGQMHVL